MKKRINQIVAADNPSVLKEFVDSNEGKNISCVYVQHALYKKKIECKRDYTHESNPIQTMEYINAVIMQRGNMLIQRDMQTYAVFPDIVLEIASSVENLFASYRYGNWPYSIQYAYDKRAKEQKIQVANMMASKGTKGMLTQLLQMCNKHEQDNKIAVMLMRVMTHCIQHADVTSMKNCLNIRGTIAMVQQVVNNISTNYTYHEYYKHLSKTYVEFMKYFFEHQPRCSQEEEIQACITMIRHIMARKFECKQYKSLITTMFMYSTDATLLCLSQEGWINLLSEYMSKQNNSPDFTNLKTRCEAITRQANRH
jgi:hypothetical protein